MNKQYFYEIVKILTGRFAGSVQLWGPLDGIHYTRTGSGDIIGFSQIINNKEVQTFKEEEILVTDRIL